MLLRSIKTLIYEDNFIVIYFTYILGYISTEFEFDIMIFNGIKIIL